MTLLDFKAGLEIFAQYYDEPNGYHLGAEHDIIYVYNTDRPIKVGDVIRLRELGWFQPEVSDNDDDTPGEYDPDEGWGTYV